MERLLASFEKIKTVHPYVHHITNAVTMNDCANMTLAAGGSPAMAHAKEEVAEMICQMSALVLNTGTITQDAFEAMLIAGKAANENGIPIVLDPVAVGATAFRKRVNEALLEALDIAVIRGNASEIMTLVGVSSGRGVDVAVDLVFDEEKVMAFASEKQTVVATSGAVDFMTDGRRCAYCHNGVAMLSEITGTGCMLASVIGVGVGAGNDAFDSALLASVMIGIAGEEAYAAVNGERKLGTFRVQLFDAMATMSSEKINALGRIDVDGACF
ncbi:MAG: hydroxyethylthiazole kinase [Turicibacter sp.]|nr:hydroxyethylthiazole kinase [Turicibacter sp.]